MSKKVRIGFIGAGVIFQDKGGVAGLTTAATLWATAAVGMASAFGMYLLAIITGGLIFATLTLRHLPGWKRISQKRQKHRKHDDSDNVTETEK